MESMKRFIAEALLGLQGPVGGGIGAFLKAGLIARLQDFNLVTSGRTPIWFRPVSVTHTTAKQFFSTNQWQGNAAPRLRQAIELAVNRSSYRCLLATLPLCVVAEGAYGRSGGLHCIDRKRG
jgi:hypothetical protein